MSLADKKTPLVSTIENSQITKLLGVEYSVLLPRERSECVEILLERVPKGVSFPIHQHKECEQSYIVLEGEAELTLEGKTHVIRKGSVVYIPRLTDHAIRNIGDSEMSYIIVEGYPEGYLSEEPSWDAHIDVLKKHYSLNASS